MQKKLQSELYSNPQTIFHNRPESAPPKAKTKAKLELQYQPRLNQNNTPPYIDGGIWKLVFEFLGANKDLLSCRLVCKKWKMYIYKDAPFFLKHCSSIKDSKTRILQELMESLPHIQQIQVFEMKLDQALKVKKKYERAMLLIPQKSTRFTKISDIAKISSPPFKLVNSIIAIMYLIMKKSDLMKRTKPINWEYCQEKLSDDEKLMRSIRETTPGSVTKLNIVKFEDALRPCYNLWHDTETLLNDLCKISLQVMRMVEWGLALIQYNKIVEDLKELDNIAVETWAIKKETIFQENLLTKLIEMESFHL